MSILAIGGGILYTSDNGSWSCTYISSIKRIIELTNKSNPNILVLSHAASSDYIETLDTSAISNVFTNLGCNVKTLSKKDLDEKEKTKDYFEWADAIFENGGYTKNLINLWNNTGFCQLINSANDKVLSGISAGACCWFSKYNGRNGTYYYEGNGIGLIDAYFVPHSNEIKRYLIASNHLRENNKVGIFIPNDCAIEIANDKYRIIYDEGFGVEQVEQPHAKFKYYEDGNLISHNMDNIKEYKELSRILKR